MSEREIFQVLIDLPAAERAEYLEKVCADNEAMKSRILKLLHSHEEAGNFLGSPAVEIPDRDNADTVYFVPDPNHEKVGKDEDFLSKFLSPASRPESLGKIGHYELIQQLGVGGFGIVFRAFDDVLKRIVAVKVLSPMLAATSPARKRFLREARAFAQVRHEHVVQVYAVEDQPLPYLVMEFIPGETLNDRLDRNGPLEVLEILRIGRQIAEGLAAAHANELIHRDVKPANILLEGGHQKVKLTDFGLARAADDASISESGVIAGTPMYMAPEQANGKHLDHRADLFSLGSVLYQMTTGRPPFRAIGTLAVLKRVAEDTPRPIREIIPESPQWLCDIITKLHAKDPANRFQSAREVADLFAECETQYKTSGKVENITQLAKSNRQAAKRLWYENWKYFSAFLAGLFVMGTVLFYTQQGTADRPSITPIIPVEKPADSDRAAAEYVLSIGGKIGINSSDKYIESVTELPREPFYLSIVNLTSNRLVTDESLANLKDCTKLNHLWLSSTQVSDRGLAYLRNCKSLTHLHLGNTKSSDVGLANFAGCQNLAHLYLSNTQITDRGVLYFAASRKLILLNLNDTKITDASIPIIKEFEQLQVLQIKGTRLTPDRITELSRMMPECRIEFDGMDSKSPDRKAAEYVRSLGGNVYLDMNGKTNVPFAINDRLPSEPFKLVGVSFVGNAGDGVGDAVFDSLKGLTQLSMLTLEKAHITNSALARFLDSAAARNLTILSIRDTRIGDAGLTTLNKLSKLQQFNASGCPQVTDKSVALLKGRQIQFLSLNRTAVTNSGLSNLSGAVLKHLSLADCTGFDDNGIAYIKSMSNCTYLDLCRTRIGDDGLKHLMKNANVRVLRVSGTRVTQAGLESVLSLQNLEQLFVGELPVGDEFLAKIKGLKNLGHLELPGTNVTDTGLEHLKELPSLKWVSVSNTMVSPEATLKYSRERPTCYLVSSTLGELRPWGDDRAAVEVFRKHGATLTLINTAGNKRLRITPDSPLPEGPYRLAGIDLLSSKVPADFTSKVLVPAVSSLTRFDSLIHLPRNTPITAEDLNRLASGPVGETLQNFIAESCELTPENFAALKRFPKVYELRISGSNATDDLVSQVIGMPALKSVAIMHLKQVGPLTRAQLLRAPLMGLSLDNCKAIDLELCEQLGRLPNLKILQLADTNLQDEWLSGIAKSTSIRSLYLSRSPTTDAGLRTIEQMKKLQELVVFGCKVTRSGLEKFSMALPKCRYTWNETGGIQTPKK